MAGAIGPIQVQRGGGCAHGLPAGACPVCSGGGAGGGVKKNNQMSWSECYAIGQAMKAARERALYNDKLDLQAQARTSQIQNQTNAINYKNIPAILLARVLPVPVQNTINNIKQVITENLGKFANVAMNQIAVIKEKMEVLMNKLTAAMNQLAAVLGEQANNIRDNIDKNLKKIKKKFGKFLEMIDELLEVEEMVEIEETLNNPTEEEARKIIEVPRWQDVKREYNNTEHNFRNYLRRREFYKRANNRRSKK